MLFIRPITYTSILCLLLFLFGCNKNTSHFATDRNIKGLTKALISIHVNTNGNSLIWDSISNTNAAGNKYSVNKINFYISNITLSNANGLTYSSPQIFYIDPSVSSKSIIQLDSIPKGEYNVISFLVGIDSLHNKDYHLPNTMDNLNMAWPTVMGGGYHFVKIEGHYLDSINNVQGFAVHLGKNINLVEVAINGSLYQLSSHEYSLMFNINEIFANPYTYDLNKDNNYTMSDSVAMQKIKTNMKDAFTIIQHM